MRKLSLQLFITMMWFCHALAGQTQQDHILLGNCFGQYSNECKIYNEAASKIGVATKIPATQASHYIGNQITGMRFYAVSKLKIEDIQVWIRSSLNGENLASYTIEKENLVKGWNEITFPQSIDIDNKDYFIGYTYTQTATGYVASTVLPESQEDLYFKLGDDDWKDLSKQGYGNLSIEAIVKGNKLPQYNAAIIQTEQTEENIRPNDRIILSGIIRNEGINSFDKVTLSINTEGSESFEKEFQFEQPINYRDSVSFRVSVYPTTAGEGRKSTVELVSLSNYPDEIDENNAHDYFYNVIEGLFQRKLLIEFFTGEACGNCPRVGRFIERLIKEHPKKNDIIITEHHTFGKDAFSIPESQTYAYMFDLDGAPFLVYNRSPYQGELAHCPGNAEEQTVWDATDYMLSQPANIYIRPYAWLDENKQLNILVTGEKNEYFKCEDPIITIFLVEDHLPAINQYHYDDVTGEKEYLIGEEYIHHNVLRNVISTNGAPVNFYDKSFSYSCKTELPQDIKLENTYIIAFISNSSELNPEIYNVERFCLYDISDNQPVNIETSSKEKSISDIQYYNIQGMRLNSPQRGINILRKIYSDGSWETEKSIQK